MFVAYIYVTVKLMKLWQAKPSERVKIVGFDPKMETTVQNRLEDLGFAVGAVVECVRHTQFSGPHVFLVHQTFFALEKSIALMVDADVVVECL